MDGAHNIRDIKVKVEGDRVFVVFDIALVTASVNFIVLGSVEVDKSRLGRKRRGGGRSNRYCGRRRPHSFSQRSRYVRHSLHRLRDRWDLRILYSGTRNSTSHVARFLDEIVYVRDNITRFSVHYTIIKI